MKSLFKQFVADENGAAMVEYSILIGIIAAASILVIIAIGAWVGGQFTGLCASLNGHGAVGYTACAAAT
ncbi:Flp family type IVb pilin [Mesorhizobium hawassense]|uniref:Flp family type IVb pilin n=1 Tax=Mesorhizobium hawassense TaxID=1209954 RepID=A0A330HDA7_9HYPH|nr:Flp family type IVb pilin [Mesorhizobium hawassense]RAZ84549.1 Flp family type IVb pilin [Mesorhizobium hawassense]